MKTIIGYSPQELKELNERGFERALENWRSSQEEIFWTDEIIESMKATFEHSGIALRNWSIGAYSHSHVEFDMESDVKELSGNRAMAWLENNLLGGLREKRTFIQRVTKYVTWNDFTQHNQIPSCPFTGYCADEDFIESLMNDIKSGDTLRDAYSNLADVARKLFENELDYQTSEEYFLEQEDLLFTEDGKPL
jgi:hypothetical protein